MMNAMDTERPSTQEKIITAAINCMEKEGIQSVTIRSIAQEAGVNSAAINYYFRSKENLIREALRYSMVQAFEDLPNFASAQDSSAPLDIAELFRHFLQGVLRYPGLARAHLYNALMRSDYSGLFVKGFNDFLRKLLERMRSRFPKDGSDEPDWTWPTRGRRSGTSSC
jgi:AcrR family transcriptional regulator